MGSNITNVAATSIIPVMSADDFGRAQARVLELAGDVEHVRITLAAGVYTRSLSLGMSTLPLDITVEGAEGVWFDGAQLTVQGRNIRIENIAFKGRTHSKSLVSITASEHAYLGQLQVVGANISGSTTNIVRSSEPPKPGERRRPARGGKRSRPAYIAAVAAGGSKPVHIEGIEISRTTFSSSALFDVSAPQATEVILRDLVAPDLKDKLPVNVSPRNLKITR